jgi:hypothetical protein
MLLKAISLPLAARVSASPEVSAGEIAAAFSEMTRSMVSERLRAKASASA